MVVAIMVCGSHGIGPHFCLLQEGYVVGLVFVFVVFVLFVGSCHSNSAIFIVSYC